MNATSLVTRQLAPVSARVNAVIKHGDPEHYSQAVALRAALCEHVPSYRNLSTEDILVYEGREVLYNCRTALHKDIADPPKSYAILMAFGDFTGGHVRIPHLGLRVGLLPGGGIPLRGRVLPHEVELWAGGQRISVPHFTHSSMWRSMCMYSVFP